MGEPISARELRHQRILESASHVFAENDYAAVSMGAVARRAQVSRGTVYNYFGSKDRLYRRVLAERLGELMSGLEQMLADGRDPARDLEHCVVEPLLFFVRFPKVALLWRREELKRIAGNGDAVSVVGMQQRLAGLVRGVIAAGIGAGVFRTVDPDAAARAILGAVEGMAGSLAGCRADDPQVSRALDELADFVSRSLLDGASRRAG